MFKKKGFTLIEVLIVVVIIMVLGTIALAGYQRVVEKARERVCAANLQALGAAVEMWALENDFLPATLGQLKQEHLEKGYAYAIGKEDWITKLSYAVVQFDRSHSAYAQVPFLSPSNLKKYGVNADIFVCPSDPTPPPQGVSYGINQDLNDLSRDTNGDGKVSWQEVSENDIIVGDNDSATFEGSPGASRHKGLFHRLGISLVIIMPPGENVDPPSLPLIMTSYSMAVTKNKTITRQQGFSPNMQ